MANSTVHPKKINLRYLAGWLLNKPSENNPEQTLIAMHHASKSTLLSDNVATHLLGCQTTEHFYHEADTYTAAITGSFSWRDDNLKQLAASKGHAEALVTAYKTLGEDFVQQLQGAFSYAIIDSLNNQLHLGTDRMGRHPLYYAQTDEGIIFGSSVSVILAHPSLENKIDSQGIYNYIYFHMVPSPTSIFSGVQKLPTAHSLSYKNGQAQVRNYWQPIFQESCSADFAEMGIQLKTTLKNAVSRSLDSTVSTGAFLSGGLDSSTVAGMLAEVSEKEAHAYSIGFSAKGYDEMAFARITAKHFGVQLHEYYVTPEDVVTALPLVVASYDEPFGNSSALPAYFCAKVAAEDGIQRLLAGDGGDELFAGNERYIKQGIFEAYSKCPSILRKALIEPIVRRLPSSLPLASKANSYINQANTPLPDRFQSYNFLNQHQPNEIFSDDFMHQINIESPLKLQREVYHLPQHATTLNRMLYLDWQYTLADNDLRKVSHTCALAGVDVAYPMLDDELIDLSCQIPSHWKIKNKNLRHFYKHALTGWLPNETIAKKKQGFGLPFGVWMETHKPLQEMAYDNLLSLKKRDFLRPEFIDRAIELHRSAHSAYYGELVWILTVLELWMSSHR